MNEITEKIQKQINKMLWEKTAKEWTKIKRKVRRKESIQTNEETKMKGVNASSIEEICKK